MKIYAPTARAARRVECPRSDAAPDSTPADFNATAHPIINRHWLGVDPFRPINLDRALTAYERLTPDLLKAVGGDRFPPLPNHAVRP